MSIEEYHTNSTVDEEDRRGERRFWRREKNGRRERRRNRFTANIRGRRRETDALMKLQMEEKLRRWGLMD